MSAPKPPLCDCPTDVTLERLMRLGKRVRRLWLPTLRNLDWSRRIEDALEAAYTRRCGCRWHEPDLHRLYFGRPDE